MYTDIDFLLALNKECTLLCCRPIMTPFSQGLSQVQNPAIYLEIVT